MPVLEDGSNPHAPVKGAGFGVRCAGQFRHSSVFRVPHILTCLQGENSRDRV